MRFRDFLAEELSNADIRAKLKEWREQMKVSWYKQYSLGKIKLEDGKIVHTSPEIKFFDFMVENGKIALPFKSAYKIDVWAKGLTSFENFPEVIFYDYGKKNKGASLYFTSGTGGKFDHLTSLEHFPRKIHGSVDTSSVPNLNLSRCNQHIEELEGYWAISPKYVGPILSTILIKGIVKPYIATSWTVKTFQDLNAILLKHLPEKDIISAKEEMMELGYKEYAKL